MNPKVLMIVGAAMALEGILVTVYSSFVLLPSTEPPMMKPIEGMDYVFFMYRQAFLISGVIGIIVAFVGVVLFWRKRRK